MKTKIHQNNKNPWTLLSENVRAYCQNENCFPFSVKQRLLTEPLGSKIRRHQWPRIKYLDLFGATMYQYSFCFGYYLYISGWWKYVLYSRKQCKNFNSIRVDSAIHLSKTDRSSFLHSTVWGFSGKTLQNAILHFLIWQWRCGDFFFFPSGYVCLNILEDVWVSVSPSVSQWSVSQTAKELFPTRGYFRTRQIWRACFSDLSWSKLRKHHRCPSSSEFLGKAHFDHGQATASQCPQMSSDTSVSAVCLMQVHPTADKQTR